jgi:hypothetical protein
MDLFIEPCLIEEDLTTSTGIKKGDHFGDNFQPNGFHHFSLLVDDSS